MSANDHPDPLPNENEAAHFEQARVQKMRRKFVRGAAAAPVLLVSGRSALACRPDVDKCGLSPMAWLSAHPTATGTVTVSHEVGCNDLGVSPGNWKPNQNGRTFQISWPSGVNPFTKLTWHYKTSTGAIKTQTRVWYPSNWMNYSNLPYNDPIYPAKDAGWNTGSKLPFGTDPRSISRILIDENASTGILWHICCAYLNAKRFPGQYALTENEVALLYNERRLVPGGRQLSDSEIKSFLDQTWA